MSNQETKFYRYALQFYKDGQIHIPELNETFTSMEEDGIDECFSKFIGCMSPKTDTPHIIYNGVRIPRKEENELEFSDLDGEIERTIGCKILEIWKFDLKEINGTRTVPEFGN